MTKPVVVTHHYDAPPEAVWHIATDFRSFAEAMKGIATFEGMPEDGKVAAGQTFDVKVRLFGWMPPMDYHMTVVACDDEAHTFQSAEHGGSIRSWEHHLSITPNATGSTLTDRIFIDAGLSTWAMRLWARFVYRRRHAPRVRMLQTWKEA